MTPRRGGGKIERGRAIAEEYQHFRACGYTHEEALAHVADHLIPPIKATSVRDILRRQQRNAA